MSRERLQEVLLAIRDSASRRMNEYLDDEEVDEQLAVWHAAEVALGILDPGYFPKRAALRDARSMLARLDEDRGSRARGARADG